MSTRTVHNHTRTYTWPPAQRPRARTDPPFAGTGTRGHGHGDTHPPRKGRARSPAPRTRSRAHLPGRPRAAPAGLTPGPAEPSQWCGTPGLCRTVPCPGSRFAPLRLRSSPLRARCRPPAALPPGPASSPHNTVVSSHWSRPRGGTPAPPHHWLRENRGWRRGRGSVRPLLAPPVPFPRVSLLRAARRERPERLPEPATTGQREAEITGLPPAPAITTAPLLPLLR